MKPIRDQCVMETIIHQLTKVADQHFRRSSGIFLQDVRPDARTALAQRMTTFCWHHVADVSESKPEKGMEVSEVCELAH